MRLLPLSLVSLFCLSTFSFVSGGSSSQVPEERISAFYNNGKDIGGGGGGGRGHTNNWAVLVGTSRYWFNYRHISNVLGMYRTVKRLGIPDSNIILMLSDDMACNTRNKFPGCVFAEAGRYDGNGGRQGGGLDLYGDNIEVDYRGYEVTVENFLRVLTGRMDPSVPRSKRLLTNDRSNIFIYMTGHGGNEFLKFQDDEEISAFDIADAFEQMWQKKRYHEILFMIDTCQANTMYSKFYSPNILATGSSELDEKSLSYENDWDIGVAIIDSYTHFVLEFMESVNKTSQTSVQDLFSQYRYDLIKSTPGVRSDLFKRPLDKTFITDFFGGVAQAEVLTVSSPLDEHTSTEDKFGRTDDTNVDHTTSSESIREADDTKQETRTSAAGDKGRESYAFSEYSERESLFGDGGSKGNDKNEKGVVRAWMSTGALCVLVGWVGFGKWRVVGGKQVI